MDYKADLNENANDRFPEGKIILLDGRVVDCYPRATDEQDQRPQYTDKEKEEDEQRFVKNAFFFLANKERILTDSRMFLCPVPITNVPLSGSSEFNSPTLGIYLEWWMNCPGVMRTDKKGRRSLVYHLTGSLLSGANNCPEVYEDGKVKIVHLYPFKDHWKLYVRINNRYQDAKRRYQAYTLKQVLEILDHEEDGDHDYANRINEQLHTREINELNGRISCLNSQIEHLEQRCEKDEKELREEKILHFYDRYKDLEMRVNKEIEQLQQQKRNLMAAMKRGVCTKQEYEQLLSPVNKRIKEAEEQLQQFKIQEIGRVFTGENLLFCQIEDEVNKLRMRNKA